MSPSLQSLFRGRQRRLHILQRKHLRLFSVSKPRPDVPLPCSAGRAAKLRGLQMSNPVVLITGGLTGIGRAAAVAFAKKGATVVVAGRREEAGKALVKELRSE